MLIQSPKGTKDLYGTDTRYWRFLESLIRELCGHFCYEEIRTPIIEHTELFLRGVGETTDVVQKEMYTFDDKGGRSISLRPEITAGVARAFAEHGFGSLPMPLKLFYIGPNFRYENPAKGRLRQHHQFGVELYGSAEPAADAEVIALGFCLLQKLNVSGVTLRINSIGCKSCRTEYKNRLREFIGENLDGLCADCKQRFGKNPLRVLDCKTGICKAIMENAPSILDSLDSGCRAHFEALQGLLTAMEIPFALDPKIVRGLDYYTRTVFEFVEDGLTVLGGGRYDGLLEQITAEPDKPPTPSIGFGMGIERLIMLLTKQNLLPDAPKVCDIFIGHAGEEGFKYSQQLALVLRRAGFAAETDLLKRSVKAQMKYASKCGAGFSMILGDEELGAKTARVKDMATGEQSTCDIGSAEELFNRLRGVTG